MIYETDVSGAPCSCKGFRKVRRKRNGAHLGTATTRSLEGTKGFEERTRCRKRGITGGLCGDVGFPVLHCSSILLVCTRTCGRCGNKPSASTCSTIIRMHAETNIGAGRCTNGCDACRSFRAFIEGREKHRLYFRTLEGCSLVH